MFPPRRQDNYIVKKVKFQWLILLFLAALSGDFYQQLRSRRGLARHRVAF